MNHLHTLVILSLLSSFLAISCSPTPYVIDFSRTSPEEFVRRVQMNNHEVSTFRARGAVMMDEVAGTGSITVSLKRPDSVLIRIEGPFGIDVGWMLLTTERFTFYDSHSNRAIFGKTTNRNIRALLQLDLTFAEVMDLLSGTTSLSRQILPPDSAVIDDDMVLVYYGSSSSTARYWIDPRNSVVVRYELWDDASKPILEARYDKFTRIENVLLPRSIRILARRLGRGLSLQYDEIEINRPEIDLSLTIPENARRIYW